MFPFNMKECEKPCICGEQIDTKHIYTCGKLNEENIRINFEEIFEDNVKNHKLILERFRKNFEILQKYEDNKNYHRILVDPLYCNTVMEIN